MRILAIGDFHGKFFLTKEFLKKNKIDFIVSPGDLPDSSKLRDLIFKNWKKIKFEKIKFYEILGLEKTKKLVLEDDISQHKIFKKLDSLKIPIFLVIGNADYGNAIEHSEYAPFKLPYKIESECKNSDNVYHMDLRIKRVEKISIIGFGSSRSFGFKGEIKNAEKKLIKLFKSAKQPNIFLVHEPPYGTKLDIVGYKKSPRYGEHVGDKIVREMIERFQPELCVCGHMHETKGKEKIGKTLVVNAGFGRRGECAIIDLIGDKAKVKYKRLKRNSST